MLNATFVSRMGLRYLISFLFLFSVQCAQAQQRGCETMNIHFQLLEKDSLYRKNFEAARKKAFSQSRTSSIDSIIYIPVIVHVLHNTPEQNISDEQVKSQIDVLNEDYSATNSNIADVPSVWQPLIKDSKIRFRLAVRTPDDKATTGIVRTYTNVSEFDIQDPRIIDSSIGGSDGWPKHSYLNIWVCNLPKGVLGYASFPGSVNNEDGVVINYRNFGRIGKDTKSPYNFGRTATHEIGHWLSLVHIWGDDGGNCTVDDNISDTPKQQTSSYRCPSFPKTDNCSPVSPGIMYMNYMDYTDDVCMSFFTPGQSAVMYNTLKGIRDSILISKGLTYVTGAAVDLGIDSVIAPVVAADSQCFHPAIRVTNYGFDYNDGFKIMYRLNEGLAKSIYYNTPMLSRHSDIIYLDEISSTETDRILEIKLIVNDANKADNYVSTSFRDPASAVRNCVVKSPYVYPNPVGITQLACLKTNYGDSREIQLRVYDVMGRVVISRDLKTSSGDAIAIDMRGKQSGLYIAEIHSDASTDVVKFIYQPDSHASGYEYSCN